MKSARKSVKEAEKLNFIHPKTVYTYFSVFYSSSHGWKIHRILYNGLISFNFYWACKNLKACLGIKGNHTWFLSFLSNTSRVSSNAIWAGLTNIPKISWQISTLMEFTIILGQRTCLSLTASRFLTSSHNNRVFSQTILTLLMLNLYSNQPKKCLQTLQMFLCPRRSFLYVHQKDVWCLALKNSMYFVK